jgi:hypothetical protein
MREQNMTEREHEKIRQRLRDFLAQAGWGSQQAMAPALSISATYIGRYASGRKTVSNRTALKIMDFVERHDPGEFMRTRGFAPTPHTFVQAPVMLPEKHEPTMGDLRFTYCPRCDALMLNQMCGRPVPFCGFCGVKLSAAPPKKKRS